MFTNFFKTDTSRSTIRAEYGMIPNSPFFPVHLLGVRQNPVILKLLYLKNTKNLFEIKSTDLKILRLKLTNQLPVSSFDRFALILNGKNLAFYRKRHLPNHLNRIALATYSDGSFLEWEFPMGITKPAILNFYAGKFYKKPVLRLLEHEWKTWNLASLPQDIYKYYHYKAEILIQQNLHNAIILPALYQQANLPKHSFQFIFSQAKLQYLTKQNLSYNLLKFSAYEKTLQPFLTLNQSVVIPEKPVKIFPSLLPEFPIRSQLLPAQFNLKYYIKPIVVSSPKYNRTNHDDSQIQLLAKMPEDLLDEEIVLNQAIRDTDSENSDELWSRSNEFLAINPNNFSLFLADVDDETDEFETALGLNYPIEEIGLRFLINKHHRIFTASNFSWYFSHKLRDVSGLTTEDDESDFIKSVYEKMIALNIVRREKKKYPDFYPTIIQEIKDLDPIDWPGAWSTPFFEEFAGPKTILPEMFLETSDLEKWAVAGAYSKNLRRILKHKMLHTHLYQLHDFPEEHTYAFTRNLRLFRKNLHDFDATYPLFTDTFISKYKYFRRKNRKISNIFLAEFADLAKKKEFVSFSNSKFYNFVENSLQKNKLRGLFYVVKPKKIKYAEDLFDVSLFSEDRLANVHAFNSFPIYESFVRKQVLFSTHVAKSSELSFNFFLSHFELYRKRLLLRLLVKDEFIKKDIIDIYVARHLENIISPNFATHFLLKKLEPQLLHSNFSNTSTNLLVEGLTNINSKNLIHNDFLTEYDSLLWEELLDLEDGYYFDVADMDMEDYHDEVADYYFQKDLDEDTTFFFDTKSYMRKVFDRYSLDKQIYNQINDLWKANLRQTLDADLETAIFPYYDTVFGPNFFFSKFPLEYSILSDEDAFLTPWSFLRVLRSKRLWTSISQLPHESLFPPYTFDQQELQSLRRLIKNRHNVLHKHINFIFEIPTSSFLSDSSEFSERLLLSDKYRPFMLQLLQQSFSLDYTKMYQAPTPVPSYNLFDLKSTTLLPLQPTPYMAKMQKAQEASLRKPDRRNFSLIKQIQNKQRVDLEEYLALFGNLKFPHLFLNPITPLEKLYQMKILKLEPLDAYPLWGTLPENYLGLSMFLKKNRHDFQSHSRNLSKFILNQFNNRYPFDMDNEYFFEDIYFDKLLDDNENFQKQVYFNFASNWNSRAADVISANLLSNHLLFERGTLRHKYLFVPNYSDFLLSQKSTGNIQPFVHKLHSIQINYQQLEFLCITSSLKDFGKTTQKQYQLFREWMDVLNYIDSAIRQQPKIIFPGPFDPLIQQPRYLELSNIPSSMLMQPQRYTYSDILNKLEPTYSFNEEFQELFSFYKEYSDLINGRPLVTPTFLKKREANWNVTMSELFTMQHQMYSTFLPTFTILHNGRTITYGFQNYTTYSLKKQKKINQNYFYNTQLFSTNTQTYLDLLHLGWNHPKSQILLQDIKLGEQIYSFANLTHLQLQELLLLPRNLELGLHGHTFPKGGFLFQALQKNSTFLNLNFLLAHSAHNQFVNNTNQIIKLLLTTKNINKNRLALLDLYDALDDDALYFYDLQQDFTMKDIAALYEQEFPYIQVIGENLRTFGTDKRFLETLSPEEQAAILQVDTDYEIRRMGRATYYIYDGGVGLLGMGETLADFFKINAAITQKPYFFSRYFQNAAYNYLEKDQQALFDFIFFNKNQQLNYAHLQMKSKLIKEIEETTNFNQIDNFDFFFSSYFNPPQEERLPHNSMFTGLAPDSFDDTIRTSTLFFTYPALLAHYKNTTLAGWINSSFEPLKSETIWSTIPHYIYAKPHKFVIPTSQALDYMSDSADAFETYFLKNLNIQQNSVEMFDIFLRDILQNISNSKKKRTYRPNDFFCFYGQSDPKSLEYFDYLTATLSYDKYLIDIQKYRLDLADLKPKLLYDKRGLFLQIFPKPHYLMLEPKGFNLLFSTKSFKNNDYFTFILSPNIDKVTSQLQNYFKRILPKLISKKKTQIYYNSYSKLMTSTEKARKVLLNTKTPPHLFYNEVDIPPQWKHFAPILESRNIHIVPPIAFDYIIDFFKVLGNNFLLDKKKMFRQIPAYFVYKPKVVVKNEKEFQKIATILHFFAEKNIHHYNFDLHFLIQGLNKKMYPVLWKIVEYHPAYFNDFFFMDCQRFFQNQSTVLHARSFPANFTNLFLNNSYVNAFKKKTLFKPNNDNWLLIKLGMHYSMLLQKTYTTTKYTLNPFQISPVMFSISPETNVLFKILKPYQKIQPLINTFGLFGYTQPTQRAKSLVREYWDSNFWYYFAKEQTIQSPSLTKISLNFADLWKLKTKNDQLLHNHLYKDYIISGNFKTGLWFAMPILFPYKTLQQDSKFSIFEFNTGSFFAGRQLNTISALKTFLVPQDYGVEAQILRDWPIFTQTDWKTHLVQKAIKQTILVNSDNFILNNSLIPEYKKLDENVEFVSFLANIYKQINTHILEKLPFRFFNTYIFAALKTQTPLIKINTFKYYGTDTVISDIASRAPTILESKPVSYTFSFTFPKNVTYNANFFTNNFDNFFVLALPTLTRKNLNLSILKLVFKTEQSMNTINSLYRIIYLNDRFRSTKFFPSVTYAKNNFDLIQFLYDAEFKQNISLFAEFSKKSFKKEQSLAYNSFFKKYQKSENPFYASIYFDTGRDYLQQKLLFLPTRLYTYLFGNFPIALANLSEFLVGSKIYLSKQAIENLQILVHFNPYDRIIYYSDTFFKKQNIIYALRGKLDHEMWFSPKILMQDVFHTYILNYMHQFTPENIKELPQYTDTIYSELPRLKTFLFGHNAIWTTLNTKTLSELTYETPRILFKNKNLNKYFSLDSKLFPVFRTTISPWVEDNEVLTKGYIFKNHKTNQLFFTANNNDYLYRQIDVLRSTNKQNFTVENRSFLKTLSYFFDFDAPIMFNLTKFFDQLFYFISWTNIPESSLIKEVNPKKELHIKKVLNKPRHQFYISSDLDLSTYSQYAQESNATRFYYTAQDFEKKFNYKNFYTDNTFYFEQMLGLPQLTEPAFGKTLLQKLRLFLFPKLPNLTSLDLINLRSPHRSNIIVRDSKPFYNSSSILSSEALWNNLLFNATFEETLPFELQTFTFRQYYMLNRLEHDFNQRLLRQYPTLLGNSKLYSEFIEKPYIWKQINGKADQLNSGFVRRWHSPEREFRLRQLDELVFLSKNPTILASQNISLKFSSLFLFLPEQLENTQNKKIAELYYKNRWNFEYSEESLPLLQPDHTLINEENLLGETAFEDETEDLSGLQELDNVGFLSNTLQLSKRSRYLKYLLAKKSYLQENDNFSYTKFNMMNVQRRHFVLNPESGFEDYSILNNNFFNRYVSDSYLGAKAYQKFRTKNATTKTFYEIFDQYAISDRVLSSIPQKICSQNLAGRLISLTTRYKALFVNQKHSYTKFMNYMLCQDFLPRTESRFAFNSLFAKSSDEHLLNFFSKILPLQQTQSEELRYLYQLQEPAQMFAFIWKLFKEDKSFLHLNTLYKTIYLNLREPRIMQWVNNPKFVFDKYLLQISKDMNILETLTTVFLSPIYQQLASIPEDYLFTYLRTGYYKHFNRDIFFQKEMYLDNQYSKYRDPFNFLENPPTWHIQEPDSFIMTTLLDLMDELELIWSEFGYIFFYTCVFLFFFIIWFIFYDSIIFFIICKKDYRKYYRYVETSSVFGFLNPYEALSWISALIVFIAHELYFPEYSSLATYEEIAKKRQKQSFWFDLLFEKKSFSEKLTAVLTKWDETNLQDYFMQLPSHIQTKWIEYFYTQHLNDIPVEDDDIVDRYLKTQNELDVDIALRVPKDLNLFFNDKPLFVKPEPHFKVSFDFFNKLITSSKIHRKLRFEDALEYSSLRPIHLKYDILANKEILLLNTVRKWIFQFKIMPETDLLPRSKTYIIQQVTFFQKIGLLGINHLYVRLYKFFHTSVFRLNRILSYEDICLKFPKWYITFLQLLDHSVFFLKKNIICALKDIEYYFFYLGKGFFYFLNMYINFNIIESFCITLLFSIKSFIFLLQTQNISLWKKKIQTFFDSVNAQSLYLNNTKMAARDFRQPSKSLELEKWRLSILLYTKDSKNRQDLYFVNQMDQVRALAEFSFMEKEGNAQLTTLSENISILKPQKYSKEMLINVLRGRKYDAGFSHIDRGDRKAYFQNIWDLATTARFHNTQTLGNWATFAFKEMWHEPQNLKTVFRSVPRLVYYNAIRKTVRGRKIQLPFWRRVKRYYDHYHPNFNLHNDNINADYIVPIPYKLKSKTLFWNELVAPFKPVYIHNLRSDTIGRYRLFLEFTQNEKVFAQYKKFVRFDKFMRLPLPLKKPATIKIVDILPTYFSQYRTRLSTDEEFISKTFTLQSHGLLKYASTNHSFESIRQFQIVDPKLIPLLPRVFTRRTRLTYISPKFLFNFYATRFNTPKLRIPNFLNTNTSDIFISHPIIKEFLELNHFTGTWGLSSRGIIRIPPLVEELTEEERVRDLVDEIGSVSFTDLFSSKKYTGDPIFMNNLSLSHCLNLFAVEKNLTFFWQLPKLFFAEEFRPAKLVVSLSPQMQYAYNNILVYFLPKNRQSFLQPPAHLSYLSREIRILSDFFPYFTVSRVPKQTLLKKVGGFNNNGIVLKQADFLTTSMSQIHFTKGVSNHFGPQLHIAFTKPTNPVTPLIFHHVKEFRKAKFFLNLHFGPGNFFPFKSPTIRLPLINRENMIVFSFTHTGKPLSYVIMPFMHPIYQTKYHRLFPLNKLPINRLNTFLFARDRHILAASKYATLNEWLGLSKTYFHFVTNPLRYMKDFFRYRLTFNNLWRIPRSNNMDIYRLSSPKASMSMWLENEVFFNRWVDGFHKIYSPQLFFDKSLQFIQQNNSSFKVVLKNVCSELTALRFEQKDHTGLFLETFFPNKKWFFLKAIRRYYFLKTLTPLSRPNVITRFYMPNYWLKQQQQLTEQSRLKVNEAYYHIVATRKWNTYSRVLQKMFKELMVDYNIDREFSLKDFPTRSLKIQSVYQQLKTKIAYKHSGTKAFQKKYNSLFSEFTTFPIYFSMLKTKDPLLLTQNVSLYLVKDSQKSKVFDFLFFSDWTPSYVINKLYPINSYFKNINPRTTLSLLSALNDIFYSNIGFTHFLKTNEEVKHLPLLVPQLVTSKLTIPTYAKLGLFRKKRRIKFPSDSLKTLIRGQLANDSLPLQSSSLFRTGGFADRQIIKRLKMSTGGDINIPTYLPIAANYNSGLGVLPYIAKDTTLFPTSRMFLSYKPLKRSQILKSVFAADPLRMDWNSFLRLTKMQMLSHSAENSFVKDKQKNWRAVLSRIQHQLDKKYPLRISQDPFAHLRGAARIFAKTRKRLQEYHKVRNYLKYFSVSDDITEQNVKNFLMYQSAERGSYELVRKKQFGINLTAANIANKVTYLKLLKRQKKWNLLKQSHSILQLGPNRKTSWVRYFNQRAFRILDFSEKFVKAPVKSWENTKLLSLFLKQDYRKGRTQHFYFWNQHYYWKWKPNRQYLQINLRKSIFYKHTIYNYLQSVKHSKILGDPVSVFNHSSLIFGNVKKKEQKIGNSNLLTISQSWKLDQILHEKDIFSMYRKHYFSDLYKSIYNYTTIYGLETYQSKSRFLYTFDLAKWYLKDFLFSFETHVLYHWAEEVSLFEKLQAFAAHLYFFDALGNEHFTLAQDTNHFGKYAYNKMFYSHVKSFMKNNYPADFIFFDDPIIMSHLIEYEYTKYVTSIFDQSLLNFYRSVFGPSYYWKIFNNPNLVSQGRNLETSLLTPLADTFLFSTNLLNEIALLKTYLGFLLKDAKMFLTDAEFLLGIKLLLEAYLVARLVSAPEHFDVQHGETLRNEIKKIVSNHFFEIYAQPVEFLTTPPQILRSITQKYPKEFIFERLNTFIRTRNTKFYLSGLSNSGYLPATTGDSSRFSYNLRNFQNIVLWNSNTYTTLLTDSLMQQITRTSLAHPVIPTQNDNIVKHYPTPFNTDIFYDVILLPDITLNIAIFLYAGFALPDILIIYSFVIFSFIYNLCIMIVIFWKIFALGAMVILSYFLFRLRKIKKLFFLN